MNHNQRYKWLRERLENWAEWRLAGVKGLGYPSVTAEARMYISPGRSTAINRAPEYNPNDDAKEVQIAMEKLPAADANALWYQYVEKIKPEKCLILCGVDTRHQLYNLIERIERDLARLL